MPQFDRLFEDGFDDLQMILGEDELLVYRFQAGSTRSFHGIVDREPPAIEVNGTIVQPTLIVTGLHHATRGILHTEVDAADQIDVSVKPGQTAETREVIAVQDSDGGCIEILVK